MSDLRDTIVVQEADSGAKLALFRAIEAAATTAQALEAEQRSLVIERLAMSYATLAHANGEQR